MTWIFGSFRVTPCALTSCQVVISKQGDGSASWQLGTTCVLTGRRPYDNHVVRFRQSAGNRESGQGHAAEQRCLGLKGGASVDTHWLPEKSMGQEEVPYLSICLSVYLSN